MHISVGHRLPTDLIFDIDHYKGTLSRGSSLNSTPDGLGTPRIKTPDNELDDSTLDNPQNQITVPSPCHPNTLDSNIPPTTPVKEDLPDDNIPIDSKYSFIRDIPKSPHLSKDFSPTGERIRDSVRARRQQRMQQNRENLQKSNDCSQITLDPAFNCDVAMEKSASEPISLIVAAEPDTDKILHAVKDTLEKERGQLNRLTAPDRTPKVRPYGEKGFIINVNTEGALTLNSVKDLEGCSDFDSSCDTSLNYIDVNVMPVLELNGNNPMEISVKTPVMTDTTKTLTKPRFMLNGVQRPLTKNVFANKTPERYIGEPLKALNTLNGNTPVAPVILNRNRSKVTSPIANPPVKRTLSSDNKVNGSANEPIVPKAYKSALDELRLKLSQCRNKLESLETAGKQTLSNSRRSMKNYFRAAPETTHGGDRLNANTDTIDRPSMYSRVTSTGREPTKSQLLRISDTPIFERRNVRSMFSNSLFRRSDSDENLAAKNAFDTEPTLPAERTFSFKQRISPTSDLKPSYSFNTNSKVQSPTATAKKTLVVSTSINNNGKSAAPVVYTTTKYHTVREPVAFASSPSQRSSAQLAAPHRTTVRCQLRSEKQLNYANHIDSKQTTVKSTVTQPSTRVSLLSPERIHRLNAKLTETKNNTNPVTRTTQTNGNHSQRSHLKPTTANRTATHVHTNHSANATNPNGRAATGNQYQQNVVLSKSNESPVRRTVTKFDRMHGIPKSSSAYLMDSAPL